MPIEKEQISRFSSCVFALSVCYKGLDRVALQFMPRFAFVRISAIVALSVILNFFVKDNTLLNKSFKFVANAPDRLEHPFVRYSFKLLAQSLYVHVNGS